MSDLFNRYYVRTITLCFLLLFTKSIVASDCKTYSCTENARLASDLQKADQRLNNEYKGVIQKLNSQQKKALLQEQREWIKFRKSSCEKYANEACTECDFSNSAQIQKQANDELQCTTLLIRARTQELEEVKKSIVNGIEPNFSFKRDVLKLIQQ